ncbi:transcriptional regulator ovo-like [Musca vetustissima]|uniref:transcriptional regulator ovo-like n=1 Tax=Musca vetustissima TaxID=27455 RepID=UPI002AB73E44|nr:transcriptional regulator ovo-like [Musca vetustissima]
MATNTDYQHKKFAKKTEEEYQHKKFATSKRKFNEIEKEEVTITAEDILQQAQKEMSTDLPQIKRKQTKPLFRPWEDKEESEGPTTTKRPKSCPPTEEVPSIMTQQSNLKLRRNTVGAIMRRRQQHHQQQAVQWMRQQQYIAYQQEQHYQAAIMEQSMRNSSYLAYLQQLALQQRQQQQLFVFGQQH